MGTRNIIYAVQCICSKRNSNAVLVSVVAVISCYGPYWVWQCDCQYTLSLCPSVWQLMFQSRLVPHCRWHLGGTCVVGWQAYKCCQCCRGLGVLVCLCCLYFSLRFFVATLLWNCLTCFSICIIFFNVSCSPVIAVDNLKARCRQHWLFKLHSLHCTLSHWNVADLVYCCKIQ